MVRYMPRPWGRMAYRDSGSGDPVVLCLHGNGCDMSDWDRTIERLPESWRTVCIDFRGHGSSDVPDAAFTVCDLAEDVAALTRELGLSTPWMAGHSLGGMVAMAAAESGVDTAGLVLVEGWTKLSTAGAFRPGRLYHGLTPERVAAVKAKGLKTLRGFDPPVWDAYWYSVGQFDGTTFLQRTTLPVAEIWGEAGRVPRTRERLCVPERPNIRWQWLRDAGHYLPLVCPGEVAGTCRETVIDASK